MSQKIVEDAFQFQSERLKTQDNFEKILEKERLFYKKQLKILQDLIDQRDGEFNRICTFEKKKSNKEYRATPKKKRWRNFFKLFSFQNEKKKVAENEVLNT